jgi:uncharacterized phage-like protein YoqJ
MIVAVSGHRPPKLGGYYTPNPIYLNVREVLRTAFRAQDDVATAAGDELMILTGMALGVDQWAAEICLEEGIKWTAVVPFHGWDSRWPDASRRHYQRLLNEADSVHVVTDTHEYRANLLYRRNAWMVDNASLVLAVWNGSTGGTANCIEYARRKRVRTEVLPVPLEIWDQARAIEQEEQRRRTGRGPQLLMNIFGPMTASPADEARMREQQEASRRSMLNAMQVPREFLQEAQQTRLLDGGREAEAARQRNLRAAMNVNNDIFYEMYTAAGEEPPTLPPSLGDAVAQSMQDFLGQQNSATTRAAMETQARAALQDIANRGLISNVGEVRVEANIQLPRAANFVAMDFAVGSDETALRRMYPALPERGLIRDLRVTEEAVAQEPTQKEIITPEKRFLPGRIIDIED